MTHAQDSLVEQPLATETIPEIVALIVRDLDSSDKRPTCAVAKSE